MNLRLLFSIFFLPLLVFSQTPCESGMAGGFPCSDYDLLDHFDKATLSNEDGSDIWGWTDPMDGKEYALMTFEDKTCFLDISDPVNPVYKGFLNTNAGTSFWRDVKVYNNYAFIVADNVGPHGMQVFDLTRLRSVASPPENFTADAVFTSGLIEGTSTTLNIGSCHNIVINEAKGMAYLVGCRGANGGGPIMIDITNPTSPQIKGQYTADGYTHDAQVVTYNGPDSSHTNKEIFIGSNESKVVVVDVTNPASPVKLSEITYSGAAYTHQGWFGPNQRYFLVGDEDDELGGSNTKTIVFDFLDLDNPSNHSTFLNTSSAIDHNLYIKGDLVFQANYTSGMRVLDISNINNITEVGYFDTYPENNNTSFRGAWSLYPYFPSGNIIVSDINRGFFVLRKTGTLSIDENVFNSNTFSVYPNPASTNLTITSSKNNIKQLQLFSILGEKVISVNTNSVHEKLLDVSGLSKGMYFVKINNTYTQKILIKR